MAAATAASQSAVSAASQATNRQSAPASQKSALQRLRRGRRCGGMVSLVQPCLDQAFGHGHAKALGAARDQDACAAVINHCQLLLTSTHWPLSDDLSTASITCSMTSPSLKDGHAASPVSIDCSNSCSSQIFTSI